MGEAKRRRELGHAWRQTVYNFVVSDGPVIQHQNRAPTDPDDELILSNMVDQYFGENGKTWAEMMVQMMKEFGFADDDWEAIPTHVRCEMTVARARHGSSLYSSNLYIHRQAYSTDLENTWHELDSDTYQGSA